jgi:hypothetical protein
MPKVHDDIDEPHHSASFPAEVLCDVPCSAAYVHRSPKVLHPPPQSVTWKTSTIFYEREKFCTR